MAVCCYKVRFSAWQTNTSDRERALIHTYTRTHTHTLAQSSPLIDLFLKDTLNVRGEDAQPLSSTSCGSRCANTFYLVMLPMLAYAGMRPNLPNVRVSNIQ